MSSIAKKNYSNIANTFGEEQVKRDDWLLAGSFSDTEDNAFRFDLADGSLHVQSKMENGVQNFEPVTIFPYMYGALFEKGLSNWLDW